MIMCMVMLFTWLHTGSTKYEQPLRTSVDATYQGSELRNNVNGVTEEIGRRYPALASAAPIGYAIGVKHNIEWKSAKLSAIPGTTTNYKYDHNSRSGSVNITWSF